MIDFVSTEIEIPRPKKQDHSFDGRIAGVVAVSLLIPLVVMLIAMLVAMLRGDVASNLTMRSRPQIVSPVMASLPTKAIPSTSFGDIEYSNQRYPTVKNCGWEKC